MNENTNLTINGNVTINQGSPAQDQPEVQQAERQPIDRTGEVLISNETTFNGLINILRGKPEAIEASLIEAEEKEREAKEAEEERKRKAYGEDYELIFGEKKDEAGKLEKADRRPGPAFLRKFEPMVARIEFSNGGFCEVFANAYAVYDNGNRKCVVWVPDCGSATYYFGPLKEKEKEYLDQEKELKEDYLGILPWYNALVIAGEDRIEFNMAHPKSKGNASDAETPEEWETKANYRWSCGTHFESPEEAYLKKEAAEERRKALTDKQQEVYSLRYEEEYTEEETAEIIGKSRRTVRNHQDSIREKLNKDREKYFF